MKITKSNITTTISKLKLKATSTTQTTLKERWLSLRISLFCFLIFSSITYKNLLSENKQLRSELDQKNKIIKDLKAENLNLQEAERKRNLDFQNIKREHSQLLEQIETFRNSNSASTKPAQNEAEGDDSDANEKVSLLKK